MLERPTVAVEGLNDRKQAVKNLQLLKLNREKRALGRTESAALRTEICPSRFKSNISARFWLEGGRTSVLSCERSSLPVVRRNRPLIFSGYQTFETSAGKIGFLGNSVFPKDQRFPSGRQQYNSDIGYFWQICERAHSGAVDFLGPNVKIVRG